MTLNKKECKHIMKPIVNFGTTKADISSTLYTAVRCGPHSLGCIGLFYLFVIKGTDIIVFLIEHYWKLIPYIPLFKANLASIQLEAVRGGRILENDYIENQQWLQTESWILEV